MGTEAVVFSTTKTEMREYWAERRRRSYGTWVAVVFAGSLTLLAAAWLPLISG